MSGAQVPERMERGMKRWQMGWVRSRGPSRDHRHAFDPSHSDFGSSEPFCKQNVKGERFIQSEEKPEYVNKM